MPGKCPVCGGDVKSGAYFCNYCGETLFPAGLAGAGAGGEYPSDPAREHDVSAYDAEHPTTPPSFVPSGGYGYAPEYMPARQTPAAPPREKANIPWALICTVLVIAVVIAGGLVLYFALRAPGINISPPPGWSDAPDRDFKELKNRIQEDLPDHKVETIYFREGNAYDFIAIICWEADPYWDLPETGDVADIERYIERLEDQSYDPYSNINPYQAKTVFEDVEPIPLECGLVGLYQAESFGGSDPRESLFIRKKDKVFWIYYFKGVLGETPSPEMQHFIATISFY